MLIHDRFELGIDPRWKTKELGRGAIARRNNALYLTLQTSSDDVYSDAQIMDYDSDARDFSFQPPLRMTVRGYCTVPANQLKGTAGFGFWNHPYGQLFRGLRIPQALWFFFAAPPNDMPLAQGVPGHGWKAATFNANRWPFYRLIPTAPLGMPLMRIPALYNALWPIGQRALGVTETLLPEDWIHIPRTYSLEWLPERVTFAVNGEVVHESTHAIPQNPLGFVAWIDNQYAIVTPQGRFGRGVVRVPQQQTLVLDEIKIETL